MTITKEMCIDSYRKMVLCRRFELRVVELWQKGFIYGNCHQYFGQEAIAVGVLSVAQEEDVIVSNHRPIGHLIAGGASLNRIMAEFMGKETGYSRGRGGMMHICDMSIRMIGSNGIVGAGIPIAAGAGLALKQNREDRVVFCFFGDGATGHGHFHEGVNIASYLKLPVVFICENNQFAISTRVEQVLTTRTIAEKASAYGIPGYRIDGNNIFDVFNTTQKVVERVRAGDGPVLLECVTYRIKGHHVGDQQKYVDKKEIEKWQQNDPIENLKEFMKREFDFTEEQEKEILIGVDELIEQAVRFGMESPEPSPADVERYVYPDTD